MMKQDIRVKVKRLREKLKYKGFLKCSGEMIFGSLFQLSFKFKSV